MYGGEVEGQEGYNAIINSTIIIIHIAAHCYVRILLRWRVSKFNSGSKVKSRRCLHKSLCGCYALCNNYCDPARVNFLLTRHLKAF